MIKRIIKIVILITIITLLIAWGTDYFMAKAKEEPIFCLKTVIYDYTDGNIKECVGLGYKIYDYDLEELKTIEFGTFLMKMKKK